MFLYNFQQFFIIMSTSKFNLKYYTFHGHEKTHDNFFLISMLVDKEKGWGSYKIEVVIKKKRCSSAWKWWGSYF
jgi:hypothetical protein